MAESKQENEIGDLLFKQMDALQANQKLLQFAVATFIEKSGYVISAQHGDTPVDLEIELFARALSENPHQAKPELDEETSKKSSILNPNESKFLKGFAESGLIAASRQMYEVCKSIDIYADRDIGILLTGPTGTGKQVVARCIHDKSARSAKSFEDFNCGAMDPNLGISELFGMEKGTATNIGDREGIIRQANGGTLFLDEIHNMSLDNQAAILKVIDSGIVSPAGASQKNHTVDVRYISGTNTDLELLCNNNQFRPDLYYRIADTIIRIPALNERLADIPLLAAYFFEQYWTGDDLPFWISKSTFKLLTRMDWAGNVRQLRSHIKNVAAVASYYRQDMSYLLFRKILLNPDHTAVEDIIEAKSTNGELSIEDWEILAVYIDTKFNDSETGKKTSLGRETVKKKITSILLRLGHAQAFDPDNLFAYLYDNGFIEPWQKDVFIRLVVKRYKAVTAFHEESERKSIYYSKDELAVESLKAQSSSSSE